ncbi:unnamed protein product [Rotaria socialis]|uniref:Protein kinase domain-containing protein n=1 Tax=Rotaria socialis TaxID=392032 RepID=A0A821DGJ6_9BILA|nr:unnamed protein product [Rotaria socialis]CAF3331012.1 unnamed protein product [Rotaria socialis]CAF4122654.1 unnamed protein product [Rotaria socialis]CAF4620119.1 unnamed protein product [Rotaria socialis]
MSPYIQKISAPDAIRRLLPRPCGTYILRYTTANDDVISLIKINDNSNEASSRDNYIILSIRVDETIYKYYIQHYRLPCIVEKMHENTSQLLDIYNQQQNNSKTSAFTPLQHELILPPEDEDWFLDKRHFLDIDFNRIRKRGAHNQGISTAIWKSDKQNDIKIFIKRFTKDNLYFRHELSLLKDLCHFSIVTLYGQYSDNKFSYLVFENSGESLESYCPLKTRLMKTKMRFISNVGFQISYAMMYLEKKNIVHRDLTASNVLINSFGFIRVADFGHAIKKEEGTNPLGRLQTTNGVNRFQFRFLAPECLPDSKKKGATEKPIVFSQADIYARFSSKSDVWSYGILLIQLMLDDPSMPYPSISDANDLPQYVKEEGKIHPQPSECPMDMYLILKQCWAYEAKNRISFSEIRDRMNALNTIFN